MTRLAALLLAVCLLCPASAVAQDRQDFQVWAQALAVGQLSENWRSHLEVWPRWFEDGTELALVIVRTAIGRQITPRLTGWAGYAWVPRPLGDGVRHEQRTWQQLSLALPGAAGWTMSSRLRLEQRWQDPWDGSSHRFRGLVRGQRPFATGSRWGIAVQDELMITFDDTPGGPIQGFDRNRLYAGLVRSMTPAATIEAGYLWEHSALAGPGARNDHVASAALTLQWPRR
jgi:hypothetical protein